MAAAPGMNEFAAHVILCQTGLDEFLDMLPEEREASYGSQIGFERMVGCILVTRGYDLLKDVSQKQLNLVIHQRSEEIASSEGVQWEMAEDFTYA